MRTADQIADLKARRKEIFKEMRTRMKNLYIKKMDQMAEDISQGGTTRAVYEYARYMKKNGSKAGFKLIVPLRHQTQPQQATQYMEVRDTDVKIREVTKYFQEFFKSTTGDIQGEWSGEPRPLDRLVSAEEVAQAASCLRNNRAKGPDELEGELLKHGGQKLHQVMAAIINGIFEKHDMRALRRSSTGTSSR